MSQWSDKFKSHPLFSDWTQLLKLINDKDFSQNFSETTVEDIARLNKVLTYADGIINKIDPELFPFNLLNSLHQQTTACISELNAFKGNKNIGHITNANANADVIITTLHQTPAALYSISPKNVSKAVTAYSSTINSYVTQLKEETDNTVSELETHIETLNEGLEEKENKIQELKASLSQIEQTIQQQTSEFNTQYQTSETSRAGKFDKAYEKYISKSDEEFKVLTNRAAKIIEVLTKFQDDASKVYGVTINTLQAGAYSSYANDEKKSANVLRLLAALFMLVGVGFLVVPEVIIALDETSKYIFDWKKVLGRLPLSLIIFVPAFYFAKESSKHRNNEVMNRRRQHILTTLDPYTELMDDDKAQELKAHVAKTVFSEATISTESDDNTSNIISQLSNLAKQLQGK